MDAQTLNRIFEPFFTTKEVGKGTGLGLATVYGIIQQHRGWIEVTSELGRGTVFRIYFPAAVGPVAVLDSGLGSPSACRGHETILLVEDEPMLREMVREVLEEQGYRVFEASCASEALQQWGRNDAAIDLLLTDMVMPEGMGGLDLATELRQRKPSLKVLFSSGYSPESMSGVFDPNSASFLPKPYAPQKLVKTVRQILDMPPEEAIGPIVPLKPHHTPHPVPA
jgi:CheY-like chemotaxis protein